MSRVLIVDDEESIRKSMKLLLQDAGYEVEIAGDAPSALQQLQKGDFDVVMTDIVMPRVTGVELLHIIRRTFPHVQVIMMTGSPHVETAEAAVRAGAFDYLTKPVLPAELLSCIEKAATPKVCEDAPERR